MAGLPLFRADLKGALGESAGVRYVDVQDPRTGKTYRMYDFEWEIALAMDGTRPVDAIATTAQRRWGFSTSPDDIESYADALEALGFLEWAQPPTPVSVPAPSRNGAASAQWSDEPRVDTHRTGEHHAPSQGEARAAEQADEFVDQDTRPRHTHESFDPGSSQRMEERSSGPLVRAPAARPAPQEVADGGVPVAVENERSSRAFALSDLVNQGLGGSAELPAPGDEANRRPAPTAEYRSAFVDSVVPDRSAQVVLPEATPSDDGHAAPRRFPRLPLWAIAVIGVFLLGVLITFVVLGLFRKPGPGALRAAALPTARSVERMVGAMSADAAEVMPVTPMDLALPDAGVVERVVESGMRAETGAVLVRFRGAERVEKELARLYKKESSTVADLQKARMDGKESLADRLEKRRRERHTLVENLERRLEKLVLKAKEPLKVAAVLVRAGQSVSAGTPLLRAELNRPRAQFKLSAAEASSFQAGGVCSMLPVKPNATPVPGTVAGVNATSAGEVLVSVYPDNAAAITGPVRLITGTIERRVSVPRRALLRRGGDRVLVVQKGVAKVRPVTVGAVEGDQVLIARGLEPNEEVLLDPEEIGGSTP
jgi:hypothetical protein